jgi:hypothetical protein
MATKELRELRHKYKEAYTAYINCVQMISVASEQGTWPPKDDEKREEKAFHQLVLARQTLLDALFAHHRERS